MKLRFLGTCAADFSPRLETDLADRFDFDARRSSSALLDKKYLIDCGPHTPHAFDIAGEDRCAVTDIFVTHLHKDHFIPASAARVAEKHKAPVRLWVRDDAELPYIPNVKIMRMKNYVTYDVNDELKVTGLPANHDEKVRPRHLLFEYGGKKLFYGLDGGWLINGTCNYLRGSRLDLLVLDGTCGDYTGEYRIAEHNSIPMLRLMLPSLSTLGITDSHSVVYMSHLAPSLHKPHAQTVKLVAPDGINVAYDGLEIEF